MFTTAQGLPGDWVSALLPAEDGTLWVGTTAGLARLANGRVEPVFTTAQGLPDNEVSALLPAGDGALWVGTADGLARFEPHLEAPILTKIPAPESIRERESVFAVHAFDPRYLTEPNLFHYEWWVQKVSLFGREPLGPPIVTRNAFYAASFPEDGTFAVECDCDRPLWSAE